MKRLPHSPKRLSRDSLRILEHLCRYRLLPADEVSRLHGLQDLRRAETAIARLVRSRLIGSDALYGDKTYYHLAPAAAHPSAGGDSVFPSHWLGPIPEKAKLIHYAVFAFCLMGASCRHLLTRPELEQHLPGLKDHRLPLNYYVELNDDQPRLGFIRVDTGGRGRWDRIVARALDDWRDHEARACFRPFVAQGQFEIAVLTALPQKAERIRDAVARAGSPMSIRVCAIPQLLAILQPELALPGATP